jgi:hypothetical protein
MVAMYVVHTTRQFRSEDPGGMGITGSAKSESNGSPIRYPKRTI